MAANYDGKDDQRPGNRCEIQFFAHFFAPMPLFAVPRPISPFRDRQPALK
jgi:hypothetical protein